VQDYYQKKVNAKQPDPDSAEAGELRAIIAALKSGQAQLT
jgi:hypothetical protein